MECIYVCMYVLCMYVCMYVCMCVCVCMYVCMYVCMSTIRWDLNLLVVHVVISGFRRELDANCARVDYYAAKSGNSLPTFRDNLSVPSSRAMEPIGCPEISVGNCHYGLRNGAEQRSSCLWFM